MELKSTFHEVA